MRHETLHTRPVSRRDILLSASESPPRCDGDGDTAALDTLREYYCTVQYLFPTGFRLHLHQHLLQLQQVDVLALLYVLVGLHGANSK